MSQYFIIVLYVGYDGRHICHWSAFTSNNEHLIFCSIRAQSRRQDSNWTYSIQVSSSKYEFCYVIHLTLSIELCVNSIIIFLQQNYIIMTYERFSLFQQMCHNSTKIKLIQSSVLFCCWWTSCKSRRFRDLLNRVTNVRYEPTRAHLKLKSWIVSFPSRLPVKKRREREIIRHSFIIIFIIWINEQLKFQFVVSVLFAFIAFCIAPTAS